MAAGNASRAIELILGHEGGYVNDPRDPGGATNKGITIGTFRRYIKPTGTVDDLKALTTEQAVHVYRRQYWDRVSADALPTGVDYAVADFAVNSGPDRAARYLQAILKVPVDAKIGPKTIAAAKGKPAAFVVNRLCDDRLAFMQRIDGGQMWKVYGRGWQRRVDEVRAVALQWADVGVVPPKPDYAPPEPVHGPGDGLLAWLLDFFRNPPWRKGNSHG